MSDDVKQYALLKPIAKEIIKLSRDLPLIESAYHMINEKKVQFFKDVKKEQIYFAIVCILALLFDFLLSMKTMRPLRKYLLVPTPIIALIFNVMDAVFAILASGILIKDFKDLISIRRNKVIWLSLLWALCIVKITLFFQSSWFHPQSNHIGIVLIIIFTLLVYSVLHFAGSGLYYLSNVVKFWFLEIWNDNPTTIKNKIQNLEHDLKQKVQHLNFNFEQVKNYFNLEGYIK